MQRGQPLDGRVALRWWLGATLAWFALATVLNWSSLFLVLATAGIYGEPVLTVPCLHRDNTPVRGIGGVDYQRDGDQCRFRIGDFRRLYPEYDALSDRELTENVLRNPGQSALWPAVSRLVGYYLVPPAALGVNFLLAVFLPRRKGKRRAKAEAPQPETPKPEDAKPPGEPE